MRVGMSVQVTKIASRANKQRVQQALGAAAIETAHRLWDQIEEITGQQHLTYQDMKAMGGPYARRRPQHPTAQGVINKQSGEFFNDFQLDIQLHGDVVQIVITNKNWKSTLLSKGTDRMVGRHYGSAIMKGVTEENVANLIRSFHRFVHVAVKRI